VKYGQRKKTFFSTNNFVKEDTPSNDDFGNLENVMRANDLSHWLIAFFVHLKGCIHSLDWITGLKFCSQKYFCMFSLATV